MAIGEIEEVEDTGAARQDARFAEQVGIDVAPEETVPTGGAARQFAHDDARAATDLEDALAGLDLQRLEQRTYHRHVARATALLEAGDAAEQRAAQGQRAPAGGEPGDQRLPLPG